MLSTKLQGPIVLITTQTLKVVVLFLLLTMLSTSLLVAQCESDCPGTNSFFGRSAGFANTRGTSNSFFGHSAGLANTTGADNSFFGRDAGESNTTGNSNSFFGSQTGDSNTTGSSNSFFGSQAGDSLSLIHF